MVQRDHLGTEKIRVKIINEVRLVRDGLASLLLKSSDLTVVQTGYDEREGSTVDVVLALSLSDVNAVAEEIQKVKNLFSDAKVVIIGVSGTQNEGLECIESGASGYVSPESYPEELVQTIRKVHRGEASCPPDILARLFERIASLRAQLHVVQDNHMSTLTQRELEVLQLVADGMSNKEISVSLGLELQTVKNHVHNILEKLRVHNRREAVAYTQKIGLAVKSS